MRAVEREADLDAASKNLKDLGGKMTECKRRVGGARGGRRLG